MTTMTTRDATGRVRARHPAVRTLWAGLGLTVLATVAPFLDLVTTGTVEDHVRDAYPHWSDDLVHQDMTAIVVGLAVIGLLGIVGWLTSIRATARGRGWARGLSATLWALGTATALYAVSAPAEPYDRMVPIGLGVLLLLPCVAGLWAVVQLWQHGRPGTR